MGRVMRKMLLHPNALTNRPPRSGPDRAPMLAMAAQMPIACARFLDTDQRNVLDGNIENGHEVAKTERQEGIIVCLPICLLVC